ncbi:hypothetical protein SAMN03159338_1502 [Sphingomonas sp. NFR04]|uniref:hypothetical protein n=1 Tax=Sphingomonas sp. NFR04 TaxID=1566283 RepID=UPI0008EB00E0|nr:hypothetical protein [Sphingomonas sp. NFR04]SFJ47732.1 hypothetical protein SAMN03159338_1502 [Sphingomonas sp. NFR04]
MTLFDQITQSCQVDNLDKAVAPIQLLLGQTDGGVASIFFDDLKVKAWPDASLEWREYMLRAYNRFELDQAVCI